MIHAQHPDGGGGGGGGGGTGGAHGRQYNIRIADIIRAI
jgi:hypothetical protein